MSPLVDFLRHVSGNTDEGRTGGGYGADVIFGLKKDVTLGTYLENTTFLWLVSPDRPWSE